MSNVVYHGTNLRGKIIAAAGQGEVQASFTAAGIAEVNPTDANMVDAITSQGGARVDKEGTEESLTPGTVQTATTLSAILMRNGTGSTVLNIRNQNDSGTLLVGPITIAANAERVIVFPTALTAADGVFIDVDSGALLSTGAGEGVLIP